MDQKIKTILNIAVVLFLVIWLLLRVFGGHIGDIRI